MLKPRSPQASFYGSWHYDKPVPAGWRGQTLFRKTTHVVNRFLPDFALKLAAEILYNRLG